MAVKQQIVPCLWFDHDAEEAVEFYRSIFRDVRILETSHFSEIGREFHGRPPGSVMTILFELNGQQFTALNGGPLFKFNEAISLQILCDTQEEIDHYWDRLSAGGDPQSQQCGWVKDKFGLSWQVVPAMLSELMRHPDPVKRDRVTAAVFGMKKLDIAALLAAAA